MTAERIQGHDERLRAIRAANSGFVADPFNGWWHLASCERLDQMTTGEPKWFASDRSELDAFLAGRLARYPTARQLLPCPACNPGRTPAGPSAPRTVAGMLPAQGSTPDGMPSARLGWWIAGRPATFATAGERPWKKAIAAAVPVCTAPHEETALRVAFSLGNDQLGKNEPDLDNLLEPLLSAIVNRRRWFGGRRPTVTAIAATKHHADPAGCRVSLAAAVAKPWDTTATVVSSTFSYPGALPSSARDPVLAEWLTANGARLLPEGAVAVGLRFGGPVNLGDIATGKVKTTIDGLWPLLGGVPGAPVDQRITALLLRRNDRTAPPGGVIIDVALLKPESSVPT